MVSTKSKSSAFFDGFNSIFMAFLILLTIYPLIHVAFASVSNGVELLAHQGILLKPLGFSFAAYEMVFRNPMISKGYMNTLFIVIVGLFFNLTLTSFGAYALSRSSLKFKKPIMLFIIFTMYFHGGLVPFYLTVKDLGMLNSLWALIIPTAISTFNLIIMRTAFEAIPASLEESARIDGANDYVILFRIILPLSMPVVAVMILYYGVSHWNAWFNAMVFLRNRSLYPLQLILREILIANDTSRMMAGVGLTDTEQVGEPLKFATIMVATVPILFIYPFLQKYFVKGVMIGAIKG